MQRDHLGLAERAGKAQDEQRFKGFVGMHRWVGFDVIADTINIGCAIEKQADP